MEVALLLVFLYSVWILQESNHASEGTRFLEGNVVVVPGCRVFMDASRHQNMFVQGETATFGIACERREKNIGVSLKSPTGDIVHLNVSANKMQLKLTQVGTYHVNLKLSSHEASFQVTTVPMCSSIANSSLISYGRWYTIDGDNYWGSNSCAQLSTSIASWKSILSNISLFYMGNSHIRNLFRCSVELLRGASPDVSGWSEGKDALSCSNLYAVHGKDYGFHDGTLGLSMNAMWTVRWTFLKCAGADAGKPFCDQNRYLGTRIGLNELNQRVLPELARNRNAYLVFNYQPKYNNGTSESLTHRLSQLSLEIRRRMIYIVDPSAASDNAEMSLQTFKSIGIVVFDLRSLYRQYEVNLESGLIDPDQRGPGMLRNHLYVPLQRFLGRMLFSHIAYNQFLTSEKSEIEIEPFIQ